MATQVTTVGIPYQVCVTSGGDVYVLVENTGYLEMWKKTAAGSTFSNVGTNQYYTTVHGKKGTAIGYATMDIDSTDTLHVVDYPIPAGVTIDLAYTTFDTSTDAWGTWVEIAAVDTSYTNDFPMMAIDASDNVWVAWGNQDKTSQKWVTTNQSGSWATTQIDDGNNVPMIPRLTIDSAGTVHYWYLANTTGTNCYRYWTSGSGWSTLDTSKTGGTPYDKCYFGAAFAVGTDAYIMGSSGTTPYPITKQLEGGDAAEQNDGTTDFIQEMSPTYEWVAATVLSGTPYFMYSEEGSNYVYIYEHDTGDSWNLKWSVNTTSLPYWGKLAYSTNNVNYDTVHAIWSAGGVWYEEFSGTPVSSSIPGLAVGGGQSSSSLSGYMDGDYRRSVLHGFAEGYTDGVSVRHGWMRGKPSYIHGFTQGTEVWYVDVVEFTASTSTGTQNITGSLGGLQPQLVFFTGWGITANDTITTDGRIFFGWTDGVDEAKWASYIEDGKTSSTAPDGGAFTTSCVGHSYYSGGSASFSQWLTDGVQIDWTAASGIGTYKCVALMIASENGSAVQTNQFSQALYYYNAGDTIDLHEVGFQPDLILFMSPQGGAGFSLGVCLIKDGVIDTQWGAHYAIDSGYFNYPGVCIGSGFVIADGISTPNADVGRWRVEQVYSDGFQLYCVEGDGSYYQNATIMAIKFESETFKIASVYDAPGTGSVSINTGFNTKAVMGVIPYTQACSYPTIYGYYATVGTAMFDGTDASSGSQGLGHGGSTMVGKSYGSDAQALLGARYDGVEYIDGSVTSMDPNGFTLNMVDGGRFAWIAFGEGFDKKDRMSAYLKGHTLRAPAYMKGQNNTTSSLGAFFHVVDAQTEIHAYLDGLEPARSSKTGFAQGTDDIIVAVAEFTLDTAGGNQSVTTTELGGLTPKAAIIQIGPHDIAVNTDYNGVFVHGFGMTDGTESYCVCTAGRNENYAPYDYGLYLDDDFIVILHTDGDTVLGRGLFSSWDTNGMTINWTQAPTFALNARIIFFAGTSLSADLTTITMGATGTETVNVGFEPDLLFTCGSGYRDDASLPILDPNGRMSFGWAVNNGDSFGGGRDGRQGGLYITAYSEASGYNCWEPGLMRYHSITELSSTPSLRYEDMIYAYTYVSAFTATGYTLGAPTTVSGNELHILAIKLGSDGRRKATGALKGDYDYVPGSYVVKSSPEGYNVLPEFILAHPYYYGIASDGLYATTSIGIVAPGYSRGTMHGLGGILNDCYSQFWDQLCYSRMDSVYNYRIKMCNTDTGTWIDHLVGNFVPELNGLRLDIESVDLSYQHPLNTNLSAIYMDFFAIGIAEYYDSTPAFLYGKKENWRGRLPRGAYLAGAATPVSSSIPAFMQVISTSSIPAFAEGYTPQTSTKAAFARGSTTASSSTPAFIYGQVLVTDSLSGYTEGQSYDMSFSFEAYLRGQSTASSNVNGYCSGSPSASSFWGAYMNGTMGQLALHAYTYGEPLRSSTNAYIDGFSYDVSDSQAAFTAGATFFPFTDDFTGTDEAPWNISKWQIEEDGSGL